MQQRVEKQLGVQGPKQPKAPTQPGMAGTVGNGKASVAPAAASTVTAPKTAQAVGPMGDPPSMKQFLGGGPTVKPGMAIAKPKAPMIRFASAYPSVEDCRSALGLDARDAVVRLMTKEGTKARLLEVVETVKKLSAAKTAAEKLPHVLRLAELRKEADISSMLAKVKGVAKSPAFWGATAGMAGGGLLGAAAGAGAAVLGKKMLDSRKGVQLPNNEPASV